MPAVDRRGSPTIPVTVLIPAHNRADTLPRALESVFAQAVAPAEVLVVDDGSTDGTAEVAEQMGVRVIRHAVNGGVAAARNSGLEHASQPWIALLDSDDEWLPHHLEVLWGLREDHGLVAGSVLRCGQDPEQDAVQGPATDRPLVLRSPESLIFPGNVIPACAAMARRDVMRQVGGFRPPNGLEDLDLWLRVIDVAGGCLTPRVTAIYHEGGGQQLSARSEEMRNGHIAVAGRFTERPWFSPALVEQWRASSAWNDIRSGVRRRSPRLVARNLLWLCGGRARLTGLLRTWGFRRRLRRVSGLVARDGGPTVALLPGATAGPPGAVDMRTEGSIRTLVRLARRPTAAAVGGSSALRLALRGLGISATRERAAG